MSRFTFRAAAALDWRRRQEDAAAARVAETEARFHGAAQALEAATATRADAGRRADAGVRAGIDGGAVAWHRNWILYCGTVVAARVRDVEARAVEVADARREWHEARRRRKALERLRERAFKRFQQQQDRLEMKMLDETARLRFVARADAREGDDSL